MCIYGMEGPGGYQLFGRTIQVWNTYQTSPAFEPGKPWLLRFFDQIQFFPVTAEELARAVSAVTGIPVLPTLPYGCSLGHSRRWPGTPTSAPPWTCTSAPPPASWTAPAPPPHNTPGHDEGNGQRLT